MMTKNDINELTDFLDKYGVDYEVVGDRVLSNTVNLDDRGITQLPDSIGNLKCLDLCLNNNKLEHLPDGFEHLQCEYLYLFYNPLTSESQQLLYKMKSRGINVIYQQTKQTNKWCKMIDPDHYRCGSAQTIDFIEDFLANESRLLTTKQKYSIGNAIKYLSRAGLKGSTPDDAITDLKKAENYIHRAITGEWIDAE